MASQIATAPNKFIKLERLKNVLLIGINRSEKCNAINVEVANQLTSAIEDMERDEDIAVAVLHGEGGDFSAGCDLGELSTMDASTVITRPPGSEEQGLGFLGPTRRFIKKPLVAAVNGYCVAGGFELALMCDMRVAEETSIFGFLNRKHGVPLIDGGSVRLPALIGLSRALDLIMTGRKMTGREAFELGIVNRLVPTGAALGQAVQLANSLAAKPPKCLQADRRSAYYAMFNATSISKAMEFEFAYSSNVITQEAIEGAKRYYEKKTFNASHAAQEAAKNLEKK